MRPFISITGFMLLAACQQTPAPAAEPAEQGIAQPLAAAVPVTLTAADGVKVAALHYPAPNPKAVILLFHQANSSKAEYATIAPRLVTAGYSALAIDQRSGGDLFGPNQTVAAIGRSADYAEAQRDLQAALAWGKEQGAPVILWGSSYSAALVFRVAADPAVKAVLAFSPGEYLGDGAPVAEAAGRVQVPTFITSASDPAEVGAGKAILTASPATAKQQYVPAKGVHGSSTLIPSRNPTGAAANWDAVLVFLRGATA
ncbi:alpha/beta hydrolase [Sphingopyxis sp. EG6]|uniref:alpha/beta hydrolase n=1 Tax=Sphingopyxis sp. EG6 TaxID=1874061 RepID=UPI000DC6187A|nr:alpha/beta hydrolase [Sphingopyxis sp. EG6]MEA3264717.1 alpha/beta hydrolase [Pseudomonadota bacterium]BBB08514.1 hypothetical protein SPYCW_1530 [Sphingopyxis sp. EG6]